MINSNRFISNTSTATEMSSGITELILAQASLEQFALLMPMLAFLTAQAKNRWVTWITEYPISRDYLASFGVNTQKLRLIYSQNVESSKWICWEALAQGNSQTVIANLGRLSEKEIKQLEIAAYQGECQGVLLRVRSN